MKLTLAVTLMGVCLMTLNGIAQNNGGTSGGASAGVGVGTSGQVPGGNSAATKGAAQQQPQGGNAAGISGNVNAGVGNADVNASVGANQNQNQNNQNNQNQQQQQQPATNGAPGFATPPGTNSEGFFNNTNMRPLAPTARSGATNSIYATNTFGSSNG